MHDQIMYSARQITLLIAVGLMATCGTAQAQGDYLLFTNQAPEGASWFTAGNWSFTAPPYAQMVPTITNDAYFGNSASPVSAIVDGPGAAASTLCIGWNGKQANLTIPSGGELYVEKWCYMGYRSPAQLVITGGVFSGLSVLYIGHNPPMDPPCKAEVIQYAGNVFITNGSGSVNINDHQGSGTNAPGYPRYRLVNGMIKSGYWNVGCKGYGKTEVEGGTNNVGVYIRLGYQTGGDGVYLQSGGLVTCWQLNIGESGTQGRYELSGGSLTGSGDFFCGYGGKGTFLQSGGTNTLTQGNLLIGTLETGTGLYQIPGGRLFAYRLTVGTNGTFEITSGKPDILCHYYTQMAHSTLDLRLTNGVVSPIKIDWGPPTINGTLNVTLQGPPESYPDRSSVVTVMTHPSSSGSGTFSAINLAPANKLIGVRVNYNAQSITLDQWRYAPNGTLLTLR